MKITVLGAAGGEVTGSAYLVETQRARVLVDCGLFQGGRKVDELNCSPLGATVMPLDAVLLTHAHLDHSEPFAQADLVFLESTYGDRDHQPFAKTVDEFIAVLRQAVARRSKVLVPTFAVGRAQLLTALLAGIFRQKLLAPFPVFLDSPMAIEASHIYDRHPELYDDETAAFLKARPIAQDLATMRWTATAEESKQINAVHGPCLVMAPSGRCNAGRILHHLRRNVGNPETQAGIVGLRCARPPRP